MYNRQYQYHILFFLWLLHSLDLIFTMSFGYAMYIIWTPVDESARHTDLDAVMAAGCPASCRDLCRVAAVFNAD